MPITHLGAVLPFNGVLLVNQALISDCGRYRLVLLEKELTLQCRKTDKIANYPYGEQFVELWGQTGSSFKALFLLERPSVGSGDHEYGWFLNDNGRAVVLRGHLANYAYRSEIRLQPDGNCVCYAHNPGRVVLWATHTNEHLGAASGATVPLNRDFAVVSSGTLVVDPGARSDGELTNATPIPIYVTDGIRSINVQPGGAVHAQEAGMLAIETDTGTFPEVMPQGVGEAISVPPRDSADRQGRRFQVAIGGDGGPRALSLTFS